MNEFFKSVVGKCFLYTLLCICIFASLILLGCFVAGNTNVFEWQEIGRCLIAIIGIVLCVSIILAKEQ
jgi:hypothetical protein